MDTMTPSTRNVTRVFRSATDEQIAAGRIWYSDASLVADALAVKFGVTLDVSAGVIAALSPMNSWGNNINLAARFLEAGGLTSGYLSLGLAKAQSILDGADPVTVLHSQKITSFYHCIVTAGITDAVVVDRHAWDITVNTRNTGDTRPGLKGKRYESAAEAYRKAAVILSKEYGTLSAAQVQSTTWTTWRNRFWAEGAFDLHETI